MHELIEGSSTIFIHGSNGDKNHSHKAIILRMAIPGIITPLFDGSLHDRMEFLENLMGKRRGWVLIGSSLGGLMAALFTMKKPEQVKKQILLAPALTLPEFNENIRQVDTPTIIIHGTLDEIIPINEVHDIATRTFKNLTFIQVEDTHRLQKTVDTIAWVDLINN